MALSYTFGILAILSLLSGAIILSIVFWLLFMWADNR